MTDRSGEVDEQRARRAVTELLVAMGHDPGSGALNGTPRRVAAALLELTSGYAEDPADHLRVVFEESSDAVVVLRDIPFVSVCEHHLLPFSGTGSIAYIPANGKVVGLSKLARTLDVFARRLQLQERLGAQVADALQRELEPLGVAVVLEAQHGCMTHRGARKAGASMLTSTMRGVFRTDPSARAEVLALMGVR